MARRAGSKNKSHKKKIETTEVETKQDEKKIETTEVETKQDEKVHVIRTGKSPKFGREK